jgi:hypothetical protein
MSAAHQYAGMVTAACFLLLFLWGLVAWFRNRDPSGGFWRLLTFSQVALGVFALTGVVLLITRGNQHWLHYAYGAFPFLVLAFAHRSSSRFEGLEWAAFAIAGLVNFGLITRGLMTGLGM